MISSLTGFGRAEVREADLAYSVEIRSVNSRFLEVSTRLPRSLASYENDLRNVIRGKVARGKVQLFMAEPKESMRRSKFGFDMDTVTDLVTRLREVGEAVGLKDDLGLSDLLTLSDWLVPEEDESIQRKRLDLARRGVELALKDLLRMSADEGENLARDLDARIAVIGEIIEKIASKAAENRDGQLERLRERIAKYIPAEEIDPGRLEQEAAHLVDRIDITEEVVRMRSHIQLFHEALKTGGMVGKRLNFILQEMNREVNTMGSKAAAPEISGWVVEIKEELEKMREQVQNVV